MKQFTVSINGGKAIKNLSENLTSCEKEVIENFLFDQPDKSTALIKNYHGKVVTLITKNKDKKHHTHNGYMFSA